MWFEVQSWLLEGTLQYKHAQISNDTPAKLKQDIASVFCFMQGLKDLGRSLQYAQAKLLRNTSYTESGAIQR